MTGRDAASGEETIEVAHEALIRGWGQLQEWLNRDREFLLWRQRLHTLAGIWEESGKDVASLLGGALLQEAVVRAEGRAADLSALEREYIEKSQAHAQQAAEEREAARADARWQAKALAFAERRRVFNLRLALSSVCRQCMRRSRVASAEVLAGEDFGGQRRSGAAATRVVGGRASAPGGETT